MICILILGIAMIGMVAAFLLIRLYLTEREIKQITEQIRDLSEGKTRKILTVSLFSKEIRNLCSAINSYNAKHKQDRINSINHEENLKQSIANLSHDLRTPLTSILGYIQMMKESENAKDDKDYLEVIEQRAGALNVLIHDFYELSVLEDDNTNFETERLDLVALVTNCLMGSYALFEQKGIQPTIQFPEKAVYIQGNTMACERIIQNLLSNALKFSAGEIGISLEALETHCLLRVWNTTQLLSEADMAHLFDRFYTADKSRSQKNTGLGLHIVKALLSKMDGQVEAASLNGSIFELVIRFRA